MELMICSETWLINNNTNEEGILLNPTPDQRTPMFYKHKKMCESYPKTDVYGCEREKERENIIYGLNEH